MNYLNTIELQAAYEAGAVLSVSLLPDGDEFEVGIVTAIGVAVLVVNHDKRPMRFGDRLLVMSLLSKLGISKVDTAEAWEIAKIKSSQAGLRNGSNRVFTADEWLAIRAARKVSRGLS